MLSINTGEYSRLLRERGLRLVPGPANGRAAWSFEPEQGLEFLKDLLPGTAAGPGQVVLVSGGIASGKTQLLHEFGHAAAQSGALTLYATGAADEQYTFGVIEQLLASSRLSAEAAQQVAALHGPAGRRLEDWQGLHSAIDHASVVRGVRQVLLELAEERHTVVLVDDLNFADRLSLQILVQLQRRIKSTRLLMVLTGPDRPTGGSRTQWVGTGLHPQHHIRLAPLAESSIRAWVHTALGGAPAPAAPVLKPVQTAAPYGSGAPYGPGDRGLGDRGPGDLVPAQGTRPGSSRDSGPDGGPDGGSTEAVVYAVGTGSGRRRVDLPARIRELSGGNPLLVEALVDDCTDLDGDDPDALPGASYAHAVSLLLDRRDPLLPMVAGILAVLDRYGSPDAVAELAGLEADSAAEVLDTLTGAGLLADGAFRHPAAAAAALGCLAPEVLSDLHVRVAELKYRRAAPVGEIARHLVASADAPGDWAFPVLCAAADHAVLGDELDFSHRCLKLALDLAAGHEQRREVLSRLASGTFRINPLITQSYLAALRRAAAEERAERAARAAAAGARGSTAPSAAAPSASYGATGTGSGSASAVPSDAGRIEQAMLARMALWNGDEAGFKEALEALRSGPEALDPQTEAVLMLAHQWYFGPPRGQRGDDADRADPADLDPWIGTARTLSGIWSYGGPANASAKQILRNCRLSDLTFEALLTAITALDHGGKAELAEQWCAVLSSRAVAHGAVTWQAMIDGVWSGISLRRGDVPTAVALAESSLRMQSWGVPVGYPLTTLLTAHTATGDFDKVEETLRHPVPDSVFNTVCGLRYLRARARYHLAAERPLAAITDIHDCRRMMIRRDLDLPVLVPWRSDLAEAYLKMGDTALALRLARQQLELSAESDACSRGAALLVLARAGAGDGHQEPASQAVECLTAGGDRLELARALKLLGLSAPQQPQPAAAPDVDLDDTRRRLQASALISDVTAEPEGEQTDSAALSEAELRVARLAVLGWTNRQISNALFITVSTVEQHLTRIYKKLGIRGRSDLPASLTV
ncbi:AAA family ATPase [Kitasatospora sp. NPDC001540]|uniref:AAA family ATPase n=1 Tax=Kitasatospora sp. NPDC001540 TaxID=3364014 RepID=UPI0036924BB8